MPDEPHPPLPWPLPGREDLRDALVASYDDGRGYHDRRHLAEVLDRLAELAEDEPAAAEPEVLLAAWYHDAVYDGRPGAEERSAQRAETELADVTGIDVAEVARLIRLTADHRPAADDRRGAVLCDADLGILAAAADRYADYVRGVREEYADVPDDAFRAGRLAVLRDLAARERLFLTATAHDRWDAVARANLAREITQLEAAR